MIKPLFYNEINNKLMLYFKINNTLFAIEYCLENDYYLAKDKFMDFDLPKFSINEFKNNILPYSTYIKNKDLNLIKYIGDKNYIFSSEFQGFKKTFPIKTDLQLSENNIMELLALNKDKCFLIEKAEVKNNKLIIKNKNINIFDYLNYRKEDYIVDFKLFVNIASKFHIIVYLTENDYSFFKLNDKLIPEISISKKLSNDRITLLLVYYLLNLFNSNMSEEIIINNITQKEFLDKVKEALAVILPKNVIQYWMDEVIIKDFKKLANKLNITEEVLFYRLRQLKYGEK